MLVRKESVALIGVFFAAVITRIDIDILLPDETLVRVFRRLLKSLFRLQRLS